MFNLGYKEVVLNSDNGVYTDVDGNLVIEGYGKFKPGQLTDKKQVDSAPAVVEESSWAIIVPADLKVGDAVEITVDVRSFREKSSQARDFIMHGKKTVFQSMPVVTADVGGIADAIAEGFLKFVERNMQSEFTFGILKGVSGDIELKVFPGFEDNFIKAVKLKRAAKCEGAENCFVNLEKTMVTEGSEGIGLGKWVEESRRFATAANVMPYSQSHGGNSQGVDVRGTYKTYMFDFQGEDGPDGWASHEYVDHSFVNAEMTSKPTHYVIYANDASAALTGILDAFIV